MVRGINRTSTYAVEDVVRILPEGATERAPWGGARKVTPIQALHFEEDIRNYIGMCPWGRGEKERNPLAGECVSE
jgi:hypothetical protein